MAELRPGEKGAAVFRAFGMPNRKPRGEWNVPAIEVGTRSTCALNLNDPVVAERHCVFRAVEGGFTVEDLGSATGTWHNGLAVRGAVKLSSGDQVVVGVTRLTLEVKTDPPACEIVVEESSFHYKKPKPGEFHSDADEWVRSEVRFGRISAVRGTAWFAGLFAVVAAVFALWMETPLQPGPLDGGHAALFAGHALDGDGVARVVRFEKSSSVIKQHRCDACHSQSEPGIIANCVACHPLTGQHPFLGDASLEALLDPTLAKPSNSCRMCHDVKHDGKTGLESIDTAKKRTKAGFQDAPGSDVCVQCHQTPFGDTQAILAQVDELAGRIGDVQSAERTERHEYGFDEFSHRVHFGEQAIDCRTCHEPAVSETKTLRGNEFAPVKFERCAACHVDGMDAPKELPGYDAAALLALREALGKKNLRVEVGWHGTGNECARCHAKDDAERIVKELATVERPHDERAFGIVRRAHDKHWDATQGTKADCSGCHADPSTLAGGLASSGPFLHGSHVETLWPASREERETMSEKRCLECHAGQAESTSVAAGIPVKLEDACKHCHVDPQAGTAQTVTAIVKERGTKKVTEFSHQLHVGKPGETLAGGCFACHAFEGGGDGDPFARPALLEGVENCTKCHTDHQNIERGACSFCHPSGAAAGSGSNVLFKGKKPHRLDWPAGGFDHFSGTAASGHETYMGDPSGGKAAQCTQCHDASNLKLAETVLTLDPPGKHGSLQMCIECHVENRGWFHWSLPAPKPK